MGAEPRSHFVPYRDDIDRALQALKEREFAAGRYRNVYASGSAPATIEEAVERCDADGTGSILDAIGVADGPHEPGAEGPNFCSVAPMAPEPSIDLFGTERPTRAMVEGPANTMSSSIAARGSTSWCTTATRRRRSSSRGTPSIDRPRTR